MKYKLFNRIIRKDFPSLYQDLYFYQNSVLHVCVLQFSKISREATVDESVPKQIYW